MSDSLWAHGPEPARFLCPWDFPGKNTGVGCHFPPPGELPDPGIKPGSCVSLLLLVNSLPAEPSGKPNSG